jgi:EmrB/QacA subfamily drug resistance transporter
VTRQTETSAFGQSRPAEPPDPRRWWALAVLCLSVVVIVLDNTILNVALPSIVRDLSASSSQLQWTVDAYTLVFACLLLTAGTLADRYGRRGALTVGLAIFGTGSALASFASSAAMLIGCRALMGVGAAFIFPTTLSLITNIFEGTERGRAIGIWSALSGVGIALGPILGGLLLDHFWWGSVFLVNVPIVIVAIALLRVVVPTSRDPEQRPLDLVGAVLSIVGLTALLYGIIEGPTRGWTSAGVMAGLAGGVFVLGIFLWWEHRSDHPMLVVSFFANPRFSAASVAITLAFFSLLGFVFLLTQYLQFVLGMTPLEAGLRLAPPALGIVIGAPLAPRIVERIGTKVVVTTGLAAASVSMALLSRHTVEISDVWRSLVLVIFGAAMGFTIAPATDSIMGSVPRNRAGVGSAVNDTTRQTGGALGVAVLGSLFTTRYARGLAPLARQAPPATIHAAKQSIGAALAIAQRAPQPAGRILADAARAAFFQGMSFATDVAAIIMLVAAFVALGFLPANSEGRGI